MSKMSAVLITGATGKQGGSLIRSLIARNAPFEVLAVTRDPISASAQKLKNLSSKIKLIQGDLDNPASIFQNAQRLTSASIWGVYSVQVSTLADNAPSGTNGGVRWRLQTTQRKLKESP